MAGLSWLGWWEWVGGKKETVDVRLDLGEEGEVEGEGVFSSGEGRGWRVLCELRGGGVEKV